MTPPAVTLPAAFLPDLRARLDALYGARLVRVVLFGSYARGEATPESDVDVLVVLRGETDTYAEAWPLSEIVYDLIGGYGRVASFVAISEADFDDAEWPLLSNVRRDGLELTA